MRIIGLILLVAGLYAAFGRAYVDLGLPAGDFQPIGFVLIVVGGVMVVLGGRRRAKSAAASKPASKTSSIGYRQPDTKAEEEKREPEITWGRGGDPD